MVIEQNRLTDYEFEKGNIWLKHVFLPLVKGDFDECYSWNYSELDFEDLKPFADRLYNFISERHFDDQDEITPILNKFAGISYSDRQLGAMNDGEELKFTAEQLARMLANMCYNASIFWDDGSHTKQEKEYFEKTIFGQAVKELDCYTVGNVQQATQSTNTTQKAPRTSGNSTPWQQRGPLSDQARGLVGQPHNKITLNDAFKVIDPIKSATNKEIHAIARPLNPKGDAGNNLNKVFITDSNNVGDCLCIFDNTQTAQTFIDQLLPSYSQAVPGRTLIATRCKLDTNGYFEVATEHGNVYIKANGLNEEIQEDVEESFINPVKKLDEYTLEQVMMYNKD